MTIDPDLRRACAAHGIEPSYADIWGTWHDAPDGTLRAILRAIGASHDRAAAQSMSQSAPPFSAVAMLAVDSARLELDVSPRVPPLPAAMRWRLVLETGEASEGDWQPTGSSAPSEGVPQQLGLTLPTAPPLGYHSLTLHDARTGASIASVRVIVVPPRCFRGGDAARHARLFGPAVQLYALRSRRNWGIGDFTDLGTLIDLAAAQGADLVGVNPLHALLPGEISPYSPSNRSALNPLYLDVEAIDDFSESASARTHALSRPFQERIDRTRAAPLVDYREAAAIKFEAFERLYAHFREQHLQRGSARARAFREFQSCASASLRSQALFDALHEYLRATLGSARCAPADWPAEYRDPDSPALREFRRSHEARIEFFEYLQWQGAVQLAAIARRAHDAGMAIGLYRDLAVGVNGCGAETWQMPALLARDMHVGAPPDEFNQKGQDWGLPPWIPERLTAAAYQPWIEVLRANMRCAGALRIDHVMGLMRLYWVPAGAEARDGAYVRYPFEALLGILALESERARCVVIGEDLGTVPDEVRSAMARLRILSYRVLYFEQEGDRFRAPAGYPADALVTLSTHDLPTLHGFLAGADLQVRDALDLYPSAELRQRLYAMRARDRERLLIALRDAGLAAPPDSAAAAVPFDDALAANVHAFLARTPSRLLAFQLEDVFGTLEQINMPTTTAERYPNWRRKLPVDLEDWPADGRFAAICAAIRAQGRGRAPRERTAEKVGGNVH